MKTMYASTGIHSSEHVLNCLGQLDMPKGLPRKPTICGGFFEWLEVECIVFGVGRTHLFVLSKQSYETPLRFGDVCVVFHGLSFHSASL